MRSRIAAFTASRGRPQHACFRARCARLEDELLKSGHLATEKPLPEDALRESVLHAAHQYVNDGVLAIAQVGKLLDTWLQMCREVKELE